MVDELKLETTYIPHLRTQFSRARAILFTGAGFSLGATNYNGESLPNVEKLVRSLWDICYPNYEFDEQEQLQDVYEAALQTNRTATKQLLESSFTVHAKECPDFYGDIVGMPWDKIYTLSVDDLLEKMLDRHHATRAVNSVSATTGHISKLHPDRINVIHLNGNLQDIPDDITFSRSQYAVRPLGDPFYDLLRHDLNSRPVVFMGTSLEEGPMWQHLALRGIKPERQRELRPRSYLVTPSLARSKQALLSKYKIVWLPYKADEFRDRILAGMTEQRIAGIAYIETNLSTRAAGGASIVRIGEIEEGSAEATEYLLGAEPEWRDVTHNRVASRDCFDELAEAVNRLRAKPAVDSFIVVTGTAGTGKSSAMMSIALQMEADGIPTAWIEAKKNFNVHTVRKALQDDKGIELVFISDADLWFRRVSQMVRELSDTNPRLVIVCECRSSKVDKIIDRTELGLIEATEYTIPYLGNNDIEAVLDVLDRENRLGQLKGKTKEERRAIFEHEAGRQMMVAMYKATHGEEFQERAAGELHELEATQKFLYGLTCVAHAHRFFLSRDEIALACGDDIEVWPRALDALTRRKLIIESGNEMYKARHRVIANFVYNDLSGQGAIVEVIEALIRIAGTRATVNMKNYERPKKMLSTFVSHRLLRRTVGDETAREIYSSFEPLLAWDHQYWLHRGALELESDNLGAAENFLRQAKSLAPNDVYIDNELAYLMFKKANNAPHDLDSQDLVDEAIKTLDAIGGQRPDQRDHGAHIAGSQGLIWAQHGTIAGRKKQAFLESLLEKVRAELPNDNEDMLATLATNLQREILSMAIPKEGD